MSTAVAHAGTKTSGGERSNWHWEAWALRVELVGVIAYQLAHRNVGGAWTAVEGLVAACTPLVVQRFSRTHVPRLLELSFVLILALQSTSESLKLFELLYYWDKVAHPAEIFLATLGGSLLLLGYLDLFRIALPRPFAGAIAMFFGAGLGTFWEFIEFTTDWFGNADLQKSNADTMTDILANDIGAFVATLLAFWIYHHHTTARQREEFGRVADWLTGGLGKLLNRYGAAVAFVFCLILGGLVAAAWFADRNPPRLPPGLAQGQAQRWSFSPGTAPAGTTVLLGDWQPADQGICRVNVERPKPGSEQPGLLALAPGAVYGLDGRDFAAATRYFEERPPNFQGSQMTAGIAFGIRSPKDFYLLEASALHDFVRLDRFIHGRRRDLREKRVRTHGNEWHELQVQVQGDRVEALLDGRHVFDQSRVADTTGGLGLWARVTATACFAEAAVEPLPASA